MNSFEFSRLFREYHKELFSHWKAKTLVEQEELLSKIIHSDMFEHFVLINEVIVLYDLVRDECVRRLMLGIQHED